MCEYGFEEGRDYETLVGQKCPTNNPKNPWTEITDHQLSIDMAKQICMIQRTPIGKQFREYFIEIEKRWNSPAAVLDRAKAMFVKYHEVCSERDRLKYENSVLEDRLAKAGELMERQMLQIEAGTQQKRQVTLEEFMTIVHDVNHNREFLKSSLYFMGGIHPGTVAAYNPKVGSLMSRFYKRLNKNRNIPLKKRKIEHESSAMLDEIHDDEWDAVFEELFAFGSDMEADFSAMLDTMKTLDWEVLKIKSVA